MKSQKANTSLMLPATTHIQPKPAQTEIISAMVIRAKVKHDAENERRKATRLLIEKKINLLAAKLAKAKEPSVSIYTYNNNADSHCDVKFSNIKSPELDELFLKYNQCKFLHWDEKAAREDIKRELTGIAKPDPTRLLNDPKAVKAIDAMLEQWGF